MVFKSGMQAASARSRLDKFQSRTTLPVRFPISSDSSLTAPHGFAGTEGLPPGWAAAVDARYGVPYYFNASTGQRLWEKPGEQLPEGWAGARDPGSGVTYYYCVRTGQRTWERPVAAAAGAPRLEAPAQCSAHEGFQGFKPEPEHLCCH